MMRRKCLFAHERAQRDPFRAGFTLLELLTVVIIMGIVLSFTAPALTSLQQSNNIVLAGQSIADQLAVARQIASSRNLTVEVRFITPTTWASQGTPAYQGYHDIQLWAPNESGTSAALDRPVALPTGIEISPGTALSPLLAQYSKSGSITTGVTSGNYVSFFVRPIGNIVTSGTTSPPLNSNGSSIQSCFLTVVPVQNDTLNVLPKNYLTLQVNPDTGSVQAYRP